MTDKKGLIFDIQKFSLQDGPGIRTIVFMKGCPLKCKWCHNPESQANYFEIAYYPNNCIYCGECIKACPNNAIIKVRNKIRIDRIFCKKCQSKLCVKACNFEAIKLIGRYVSVQELLKELKKDDVFYRRSNGGITISGGEPLLQADFVRALLKEIKKNNYNTAIETCCFCHWEQFEKVIEYTDLFLCDIKNMDEKMHLRGTGVKNSLILDNIRKLSRVAKRVIITIPIIPRFNDNDQNMKQVVDFALKNSINEIHLLPYHSFGTSKYKAIGKKYNLHDIESPKKSQIDHFKKVIEFNHIQCEVVV